MKYIRTNIDTYGWLMTQEKRQELIDCARNVYNYIHFDIPIIKQADTIEELCDEFVCVTYDDDLPLLDTFDKIMLYATAYPDNVKSIYGAIWTEKGLIYIAKMNNKGEFELL